MFLNENYVLSNELVQKMDINISNISALVKRFEDEDDNYTIIKMNNCTFINKKSHKLPRNIINGLVANKFTDISNKLPCTFVRAEYNITERELFNSGIATKKVTIASKDFYVFSDDFVKTMYRKIGYTLNATEVNECYDKGQIEGFIKLGKNKFFSWY